MSYNQKTKTIRICALIVLVTSILCGMWGMYLSILLPEGMLILGISSVSAVVSFATILVSLDP